MTQILWATEYLRPWLTTLFSAGTFAIAANAYRTWRRGKTDDLKIEADTLKIEADVADRLSAHYATELASLRDQIIKSGEAHQDRQERADRRYTASMEAADQRERECQEQVGTLRKEIQKLSDEVFGLRRQLSQTSRSAIILAGHVPTDNIAEAAERAALALDSVEDRQHPAEGMTTT